MPPFTKAQPTASFAYFEFFEFFEGPKDGDWEELPANVHEHRVLVRRHYRHTVAEELLDAQVPPVPYHLYVKAVRYIRQPKGPAVSQIAFLYQGIIK